MNTRLGMRVFWPLRPWGWVRLFLPRRRYFHSFSSGLAHGGRLRGEGKPEIVHDRGPQFLAHEWVAFVGVAGMTDVRTMAHHS